MGLLSHVRGFDADKRPCFFVICIVSSTQVLWLLTTSRNYQYCNEFMSKYFCRNLFLGCRLGTVCALLQCTERFVFQATPRGVFAFCGRLHRLLCSKKKTCCWLLLNKVFSSCVALTPPYYIWCLPSEQVRVSHHKHRPLERQAQARLFTSLCFAFCFSV